MILNTKPVLKSKLLGKISWKNGFQSVRKAIKNYKPEDEQTRDHYNSRLALNPLRPQNIILPHRSNIPDGNGFEIIVSRL